MLMCEITIDFSGKHYLPVMYILLWTQCFHMFSLLQL